MSGITIGVTVGIIAAIIGLIRVILSIPAFILHIRRPKIRATEMIGGNMYRCTGSEMDRRPFSDYWGLIFVSCKLTVSHKQVTIVEAELSHKFVKLIMRSDREGNCPPPRDTFSPITLTPNHGEKSVETQFVAFGAKKLFDAEREVDGIWIPMTLRLRYEYNGVLRWTKPLKAMVCPFDNKIMTGAGPKYIDEQGNPIELTYKTIHNAVIDVSK